MHGLGNDFVFIDRRNDTTRLSAEQAAAIADRRLGVGCDQIIEIEQARDRQSAAAFMRIHNADGTPANICGNAARCLADRLFAESGAAEAVIDTAAGPLRAWREISGLIAVDMGMAKLSWQDVPLAREMDTAALDLRLGPLSCPVAVGMGNPHAVFFVDKVDAVDLARLGPVIERHSLFPERTNVEIVQVLDSGRLRMRVWERGAGITRACGSGACAAGVAAARRELAAHDVEVVLDGGSLRVCWQADGHVVLSGPVTYVFDGELSDSLLGVAAKPVAERAA